MWLLKQLIVWIKTSMPLNMKPQLNWMVHSRVRRSQKPTSESTQMSQFHWIWFWRWSGWYFNQKLCCEWFIAFHLEKKKIVRVVQLTRYKKNRDIIENLIIRACPNSKIWNHNSDPFRASYLTSIRHLHKLEFFLAYGYTQWLHHININEKVYHHHF